MVTAWWTLASASHSPAPASVTITGSLQSEVGCFSDWDPACPQTAMTFDATDGIWQKTLDVPAGVHFYKAALNGGWVEAHPPEQIAFVLPGTFTVRFYYDHETHFVTDSISSVIVVAAGNFQSELGCPGDFDPGCLRSWLRDPDGDGTYVFETTGLPPGDYSALAAINESWNPSYGLGGVPGVNIPFDVAEWGELIRFEYHAPTHILTITAPFRPETPSPTLETPTLETPTTAGETPTVPGEPTIAEPTATMTPPPDPGGPAVPGPGGVQKRLRLAMLARDGN